MDTRLASPSQAAAALVLALSTGACSLAPTYEVPEAAHPAGFKEIALLSPAAAERWKQAQPADDQARADWWKVFDDAQLDRYEVEALAANQSLQAAFARLQQARALQRSASSARYPSVGVGFGPSRQLDAPGSLGIQDGAEPSPQTVWRAQTTVAYEVDLFGRVASLVAAANAEAERSEALMRSVLLSLQADVADIYFRIRELDAEVEVLNHSVELRAQALEFVQNRFDAGDVSGLEVAQATAELTSARSDRLGVVRQRASLEHALAVLLGKAPIDLVVEARPLTAVRVRVPAGLPSSLLERRPDIAAAERAMAAENARIGVARAAFFPSLALTGTGGFESAGLGELFQWSSRAFLLGPLVGTALNLPIFDWGLRSGNLANARARYEEDVANYRQQVLIAFKEVEDNLADLRILEEQTSVQEQSVNASLNASQIARTQYENGSVSYLNVIDTERTLLQARRTAVQLTGAQALSTVSLIRSLGGGWVAAPTAPIALAGSREQ